MGVVKERMGLSFGGLEKYRSGLRVQMGLKEKRL